MKKHLLFFTILAAPMVLGQDVRDLVRFSQTQTYGSARFEAMAGSFGALGADLSTSTINPAGYGRYSSSTFGMSFGHNYTRNSVLFNGIKSEEKVNAFRLNNLGFVLTNDISKNNKGFIFNQFGFSYNRIENFKDAFHYKGQQYRSLLDHFASSANGMSVNDLYTSLAFTSGLAWDTYAIDPNGSGGYFPRLDQGAEVIHQRSVNTRGGMSEYNFSASGNYMNKLYVGFNWGIRTGRYIEDYEHREEVVNNNFNSLDSFQYEYHLKTRGSGNIFRIGAIYLPIEQLRMGLSIHTPSFFEFKDEFSADMVSYHKDTTYYVLEEYKPEGEYKYRLRTPPKLVASLAYVFGTRGAINVDAEWMGYGLAHLKTTQDENYEPYDYSDINREARDQVRSVINLRVGGELVFHSQYFLRAGYAIYPSAYKEDLYHIKPIQIYSFGLGFKWKRSSLDFAFRFEERNYPYFAFPESSVDLSSQRQLFSLNYQIGF
ncbi:MAG: hypothetical protein EP338_07410 [Bacteroidetes bacterium]|nr:MAG: hypothetical protein EP338_07410 [Bacteroidota bacterium]